MTAKLEERYGVDLHSAAVTTRNRTLRSRRSLEAVNDHQLEGPCR